MDPAPRAVLEATRRLLRDVERVGRLVHDDGAAGTPVPVRGPSGEVGPWFVPVVVGDRIAGFALVDVPTPAPGSGAPSPTARVRRWSTFQRHEGDVASCPEAHLWTEPSSIAATARAAVGAVRDAPAGEPVLTWERSPEHLVWEVDVDGRTVHVAGPAAWPA